MPPTRVDTISIILTLGVAHTAGPDEIIHISETRLSELLSRPAHRGCPVSEPNVGSEEQQDRGLEVTGGDGDTMKKRKRASTAPKKKRQRIAPKTMTRRWQEVWSCKFT
jgi:hypothetical protein